MGKKSFKGRIKAAARSVPLETKRRFVVLLHSGSPASEAAKSCELTREEAVGIIKANTDMVPRLRKPEDVR